MMYKHLIAALLSVFVLVSCGLIRSKPTPPPDMPLLLPVLSSSAGVLKQRMTILAGNRLQTFILISHDHKKKFEVSVLTPTGQQLLSMSYDGEKFYEQNKTGVKLPAREIMAMIQFSVWPASAVNQAYDAADGWSFSEEPTLRLLNYQQQPILKVQYTSGGNVVIDHALHQYRVHVQALE